MNNKLEHSALPNLDELKQFHDGSLPPSRMKEIRDIANENPLLKECLEGYAATGAFVVLPSFESTGLGALGTNANAAATGASVGSSSGSASWWAVVKSSVTAITTTKLMVGVALVAVGVGVVVTQVSDKDRSAANIPQAVETMEQLSPTITDTMAIGAQLIEPTTPLSSTHQMGNSEAPIAALPEPMGPQSSGNGAEQVSPLHTIESTNVEGQNPSDAPLLETKRGIVAVSMTSILNYRVADYTDFRKAKWKSNVFSERHTPANLESHHEASQPAPAQEWNYLGYIEMCLKYHDNKQNKQAKEGFDALLKLYPDDVNAQFYGAMARYANGEYEASIPLFVTAEKNSMRPFREDAKFYRAMALKNANRMEEASALLNEIANAGGFYAKRAMGEK